MSVGYRFSEANWNRRSNQKLRKRETQNKRKTDLLVLQTHLFFSPKTPKPTKYAESERERERERERESRLAWSSLVVCRSVSRERLIERRSFFIGRLRVEEVLAGCHIIEVRWDPFDDFMW